MLLQQLERSQSGLRLPDFLTCGGQPKSHQSPRMRPAGCGLRRQREAGGEGTRLSATHAEECFHTSRSPAEDRGENEIPGGSEFKPLHPTYVSLLPVPVSLFIQTLTLQTVRTCQQPNSRPDSAEPLHKFSSVWVCLFLGGMKAGGDLHNKQVIVSSASRFCLV